jgi:hypothetical protein
MKQLIPFLFLLPVLFWGCKPEEITIDPLYSVSFNVDGQSYEMKHTADLNSGETEPTPDWGTGSGPVGPGLIWVRKEAGLKPSISSSLGEFSIAFCEVVDTSAIVTDQFGLWEFADWADFEALFASDNWQPVTSSFDLNGVYFTWRSYDLDPSGQPFYYYSYPYDQNVSQLPDSTLFSFSVTSTERRASRNWEDGLMVEGTFSGMLYRSDGVEKLPLTDGQFKYFFPFSAI